MRCQVRGRETFAATGSRRLDPALPAVVFVHGSGLDHSVWTLPARYFASHGFAVLAPDLPGHGGSAGEPLASIESMADWLAELLDACGLASAAVVGHSMGSLAALQAAASHPRRIDRVALLGISVPMPVSEALLAAAESNDHAALDMLTIWGHRPAALLGGNANIGMWMSGAALRLLERAAPGVLYADLNACQRYQNGLQAAAELACPSLLVLAERDVMTPPAAARNLAAALTDARTVRLADCGHMMLAEQPDAVLDALIEFLGRAGK